MDCGVRIGPQFQTWVRTKSVAWIRVEFVAGIGVWLMTRFKAVSMKEFVNFSGLPATEFNSGKLRQI